MAGYKGHLAAGAAVGACVGLGTIAAPTGDWAPSSLLNTLPYWNVSAPRQLALGGSLAATSLLFSLLPDADTDSKGQRLFGALLLAVLSLLISFGRFREAAIIGLMGAVPMACRHRGWTHTWGAVLIVPSPLLILPYLHMPEIPFLGLPYYLAAVAGYLSHLALDGML